MKNILKTIKGEPISTILEFKKLILKKDIEEMLPRNKTIIEKVLFNNVICVVYKHWIQKDYSILQYKNKELISTIKYGELKNTLKKDIEGNIIYDADLLFVLNNN